MLADTVSLIRKAYKEQREWDCFMLFESIRELGLEEMLWVNLNLEAGPRAAIKRFQLAEQRAKGETNGTDENR